MSKGIISTALALSATLAAAAPATASAEDELRCHIDAKVRLSEGLRLGWPLQAGKLRSPERGAVRCSGALDGRPFVDAPGTVVLRGTFGDGPVSDPAGDGSGGATCSHNDGYIDATLEFSALGGLVTVKAKNAYWLRNAMAVINGVGTIGDAPLTFVGLINYRDGTCLRSNEPIHVAGFAMELTARGDIPHGVEPDDN